MIADLEATVRHIKNEENEEENKKIKNKLLKNELNQIQKIVNEENEEIKNLLKMIETIQDSNKALSKIYKVLDRGIMCYILETQRHEFAPTKYLYYNSIGHVKNKEETKDFYNKNILKLEEVNEEQHDEIKRHAIQWINFKMQDINANLRRRNERIEEINEELKAGE